MSNKSLLIKAPASIDADLPIWNALKITWKVLTSYKGSSTNLFDNSGPFKANDKFEITEQEAGKNVAISKIDYLGNIIIGPNTEDITQYTVTVTGDDVYDIKSLGDRDEYRIIKVDSMFGEGLDTIENLTNLILISMPGSGISGDIGRFNNIVNLDYLDVSNTGISGDIAQLKTLTKLQRVWVTNDNVYGDLSVLPSLLYISAGSTDGKQKFSWSSPTARSSKTNIPLVINEVNFGDDLDNFLKDQAACTNYSGNVNGKTIAVKGNRTSASDSAIATLQNNGWTVKIS